MSRLDLIHDRLSDWRRLRAKPFREAALVRELFYALSSRSRRAAWPRGVVRWPSGVVR